MSAKIEASGKPRFSETMWFKKGEMDEQLALATPGPTAPEAAEVPATDSLPIEDRYVDDGTLTQSDSQRYSLRTGQTSQLRTIAAEGPAPGRERKRVSERELIREMTRSRAWIAGAVVLAAIGVAAGAAPLLQLLH